jgi:dienelactone hydrolase
MLANLASHGYVVVAFDDLSYEPAPPGESERQRAVREGATDFRTREAYELTLRHSDVRVARQAEKAGEILDRFTAIANDADTPWGGRIAAARIGFVGYSFGGSTAAELAARDPRVAAVVNIDGALYGRAEREGVTAPYLLFLSDMRAHAPIPASWRRDFEHMLIARELARAQRDARIPGNEVVELPLSGHLVFSDQYFERYHFRDWLKIDPFTAHGTVRLRMLAFLNRTLPLDGGEARERPEPASSVGARP